MPWRKKSDLTHDNESWWDALQRVRLAGQLSEKALASIRSRQLYHESFADFFPAKAGDEDDEDEEKEEKEEEDDDENEGGMDDLVHNDGAFGAEVELPDEEQIVMNEEEMKQPMQKKTDPSTQRIVQLFSSGLELKGRAPAATTTLNEQDTREVTTFLCGEGRSKAKRGRFVLLSGTESFAADNALPVPEPQQQIRSHALPRPLVPTRVVQLVMDAFQPHREDDNEPMVNAASLLRNCPSIDSHARVFNLNERQRAAFVLGASAILDGVLEQSIALDEQKTVSAVQVRSC